MARFLSQEELNEQLNKAKDGDAVKLPGEYEFNEIMEQTKKQIRQFDTGAIRDADDGKFDYEGFLSPLVLERYAEYMHQHRKQSDGKMRNSDNWQKGIPFVVYMKSLWRHFFDLWKIHRSANCPIYDKKDGHLVTADESLCAIIFNASGYLYELLKPEEPTAWQYGVPPTDREKCSESCERINSCSHLGSPISIR